MDIIKASGEKEKFSKEKLYKSLKKAGTEPKLAEKVCKEVAQSVYPGITSEKILDQVTSCLRKENPILAARYNLKRAIMELGPTGFPFEKYVAEILKEYGYAVKTGEQVKGYCVSHEIDVIAQKDYNPPIASSHSPLGERALKKHFMIECKYHNNRGTRSDVKVVLYIYARFLDVKKAWEKIPGHQHFFHQAWLVTNTKCTSEAIRYARCVGLKIISWHYPKNESPEGELPVPYGVNLEHLIEKKGLYPVTILPSLTKYIKEKLAREGLILAKDLLKYSPEELMDIAGLQLNVVKKLQEEVKELCRCQ